MMRVFLIGLLAFVLVACGSAKSDPITITGEAKVWETLTFDYEGPVLEETKETFQDYIFTIIFEQENTFILMPGYFAADGNAAETGATSGKVWRVKFTPPNSGEWTYSVYFENRHDVEAKGRTFRKITELVMQGSFTVAPADLDPSANDFVRRGMLMDVKGRYLKYGGETNNGTGESFIKTGAGSPENLLAYSGFDGTYDVGGTNFPALSDNQLHEFEPHLKDAREGDPTWKDGEGASILGIANYYKEVGVNAQYIVTMNVEGDGQDVFPWISHDDPYVFDVSKLEQWQRVLEHYNSRGVLIDMLLTETENESWFEAIDGVKVGEDFSPARKLYYREMVARFGHLNGLVWNLGEENGVDGNSGQDPYRKATRAKQRLAFAKYISDLDPYGHAIVSHNWPDAEEATYGSKLGVDYWSGISLQAHTDYAKRIYEWARTSSLKGRPWMVTVDEPLGWEYGARPSADVTDHRREIEGVLWPTLLAGGAGVDWYFGWQNNASTSDLSNEDQRSRDELWKASTRVADFFRDNFDMTMQLPYLSDDGLVLSTLFRDQSGERVALVLRRALPEVPEGEGHNPWEYKMLSLTYQRGDDVFEIDPMNPQMPTE